MKFFMLVCRSKTLLPASSSLVSEDDGVGSSRPMRARVADKPDSRVALSLTNFAHEAGVGFSSARLLQLLATFAVGSLFAQGSKSVGLEEFNILPDASPPSSPVHYVQRLEKN